jgi:hypothetical protein
MKMNTKTLNEHLSHLLRSIPVYGPTITWGIGDFLQDVTMLLNQHNFAIIKLIDDIIELKKINSELKITSDKQQDLIEKLILKINNDSLENP